MNYDHIFDQAIERLHSEGRYRVFIDILRNKGAYPNARCFAGHNGPKDITVWCSKMLSSITVKYRFFIPSGLHPPRIYPVTLLMSAKWIISTDFSPAARAAFFISSSACTGTQNTT